MSIITKLSILDICGVLGYASAGILELTFVEMKGERKRYNFKVSCQDFEEIDHTSVTSLHVQQIRGSDAKEIANNKEVLCITWNFHLLKAYF